MLVSQRGREIRGLLLYTHKSLHAGTRTHGTSGLFFFSPSTAYDPHIVTTAANHNFEIYLREYFSKYVYCWIVYKHTAIPLINSSKV